MCGVAASAMPTRDVGAVRFVVAGMVNHLPSQEGALIHLQAVAMSPDQARAVMELPIPVLVLEGDPGPAGVRAGGCVDLGPEPLGDR